MTNRKTVEVWVGIFVAAGVFADSRDAVARCVHVSDTVEPNTAWTDAYEEGYARYRLLYPAIKEVV